MARVQGGGGGHDADVPASAESACATGEEEGNGEAASVAAGAAVGVIDVVCAFARGGEEKLEPVAEIATDACCDSVPEEEEA